MLERPPPRDNARKATIRLTRTSGGGAYESRSEPTSSPARRSIRKRRDSPRHRRLGAHGPPQRTTHILRLPPSPLYDRSTRTRARRHRCDYRHSNGHRTPTRQAPRFRAAFSPCEAQNPKPTFRFPTISPRNSIPATPAAVAQGSRQEGLSATSVVASPPAGRGSALPGRTHKTVHGVCSRLAVTPIVAPCPRHNARRGNGFIIKSSSRKHLQQRKNAISRSSPALRTSDEKPGRIWRGPPCAHPHVHASPPDSLKRRYAQRIKDVWLINLVTYGFDA